MSRPELNNKLTAEDFSKHYWLKSELYNFCKSQNIPATGAKMELSRRIISFINAEKIAVPEQKTSKKKSKFDWHGAELNAQTVITDNYKNTQNVRTFFLNEIGPQFKFNIEFMNWLKTNSGKNLGQAAEKWREIYNQLKSPEFTTEIAPQFEYNTFIRSYFKENPSKNLKDAIKAWKELKLRPKN